MTLNYPHNCVIKTSIAPDLVEEGLARSIVVRKFKLSRRHEFHQKNIEEQRKANLAGKRRLYIYKLDRRDYDGLDDLLNEMDVLLSQPFRKFLGSEGLELFRKESKSPNAKLVRF